MTERRPVTDAVANRAKDALPERIEYAKGIIRDVEGGTIEESRRWTDKEHIEAKACVGHMEDKLLLLADRTAMLDKMDIVYHRAEYVAVLLGNNIEQNKLPGWEGIKEIKGIMDSISELARVLLEQVKEQP